MYTNIILSSVLKNLILLFYHNIKHVLMMCYCSNGGSIIITYVLICLKFFCTKFVSQIST